MIYWNTPIFFFNVFKDQVSCKAYLYLTLYRREFANSCPRVPKSFEGLDKTPWRVVSPELLIQRLANLHFQQVPR